MQKMFRFKYEPCKGDCYAWCDSLPEELNKLSDSDRQFTIETMIKAHNHLCDNPEYSFGIDRDNKTGMFVAHFRHPKATDTYLLPDFKLAVSTVCNEVLSIDIPKVVGDCSYGANGDENLGAEILRACVDLVYRREHHENCLCAKKSGMVG